MKQELLTLWPISIKICGGSFDTLARGYHVIPNLRGLKYGLGWLLLREKEFYNFIDKQYKKNTHLYTIEEEDKRKQIKNTLRK